MAIKKYILSTALILSVAAFVGCGKNKSNSNMTAQGDATLLNKWDTFADFVGIARTADTPSFSDPVALTAVLSTPPTNFQPAPDGSNAIQYTAVQTATANFVVNDAPNMQATKIVSIVPIAKFHFATQAEHPHLLSLATYSHLVQPQVLLRYRCDLNNCECNYSQLFLL